MGFIMAKDKVLIVEDEEGIRQQLKWGLAKDYYILTADERNMAMAIFKNERPGVVILDLGLPPLPQDSQIGLSFLQEALRYSNYQ